MLPDRIESKIAKQIDGCWLWTAYTNPGGYGRMKYQGTMKLSHRVTYELANGPIPPELELDHLCRQRSCVNPAHLEPVTRRENVHRGAGPAGINSRKTHCNYGHPFSGANLYVDPDGYRYCRICNKRRTVEFNDRHDLGS